MIPYLDITGSDIYRELMNEMRWRRDTEFKLLTVHITACAAATVLMMNGLGKGHFIEFLTPIVAGCITLISWIAVIWKVRKENKIYRDLGRRVVFLWENKGLFTTMEGPDGGKFLPEDARKFGTGGGSLNTQFVIHGSALVILGFSGLLLLRATALLGMSCCWLIKFLF